MQQSKDKYIAVSDFAPQKTSNGMPSQVNGLALIPPWISEFILFKMWDDIK